MGSNLDGLHQAACQSTQEWEMTPFDFNTLGHEVAFNKLEVLTLAYQMFRNIVTRTQGIPCTGVQEMSGHG